MKQQPVEILITNDDGYTSKGINFLANLLEEYGNVTVVAPEVVQSGMSAALSMGKTLRLEKKSQTVGNHGNSITVYSLTGTPVDCIKMAMKKDSFRIGKTFDLMYVNPQSGHFDPRYHFAFLRSDGKEIYLVTANFSQWDAQIRINIPKEAFDYLGINGGASQITVSVGAYNGNIVNLTSIVSGSCK